MKQLTWKLVLPLTIISFATFTKWWYILPVDAPDTMMTGFPLPYLCSGWHTSLSLQVFMTEFMIDLLAYFAFWFLLIFMIDRFLTRIRIHKILTIALLTLSGLFISGAILIASNSDNIFHTKRPWNMDIMATGYKFIWQHHERPDFDKYYPTKK